jgi:phosphate starvation-inducible PhoH-like protein
MTEDNQSNCDDAFDNSENMLDYNAVLLGDNQSSKKRKSKKAMGTDPAFYKETPVPAKKAGKRAAKNMEKELLAEYLENEWSETVENPGPTVVLNTRPPQGKEKKSAPPVTTPGKKEKRNNKKPEKEDPFVRPKTKHQEEFVELLKNKGNKIVIVTGPAGTGKTLLATEHGIRAFITGEYEKMVFTRPSVSVDEDLGFLPGTLEEKMAPWIRPIYDVLYEHISPKEVEFMIDEKIMEIAPLGFMRGRTFKNTWIVADEMQNSTPSQMKMLLTRLGENSRLIVTGDLEQYDRVAGGGINGLEDFLRRYHSVKPAGRVDASGNMDAPRPSSIRAFEFKRSDIQREEVVKDVLNIYG